MLVLKKPMIFGPVTRFCTLQGLLLSAMSLTYAADGSLDTNASTSNTSATATGSAIGIGANVEDPPLIDLSDLLSLLGEIPTLYELEPKSGIIGNKLADQNCDGNASTIKVAGSSESGQPAASTPNEAISNSTIKNEAATNGLNGQNPLRARLNSPAKVSKATDVPKSPQPSPETKMVGEKGPLHPKQKSTETKPLALALELDLGEVANEVKDEPKAEEAEKNSDAPTTVVKPELSEAKMEGENSEAAPKVSRTTLPSDPPALMVEKNESPNTDPETLELAELESIAELKVIPIEDSETNGDKASEVTKKSELKEEKSSRISELEANKSRTNASTKEKREPFQDAGNPKPRPKIVKVKPLTEQDQESPVLDKDSREMDSKQAREEDEKAVEAKRPTASKKSFVETPPPPANIKSTVPAIQQTPAEIRRQQRVENCLAYYIANPETVVERSPWAVMHAMLPFGVEGEVIVGNKRVNSIQWMCYNGTCRTQKMFTPVGRTFRPNVGGGVQGHEGQFLAMLAQSQVSADYPIVVGKNRFSVLDLVRYEMATCQERTELTFKLIALSYYVDTNQSWTAADRKRWNIEKLVEQELAQPIVGSACGGTHRLMGLTFALRQRKAEGKPIDGHFARAEKYIADYIDYAWTLQNPDGSFSTNWFESRGEEQNKERKVQTTGHILEWLMFTLPKEQLKDPRIAKSVDFLLSNIWDERNHKWPIGPRGHAERAIALYQQRVYGAQPGQRHTEMAARIESLKLRR